MKKEVYLAADLKGAKKRFLHLLEVKDQVMNYMGGLGGTSRTQP